MSEIEDNSDASEHGESDNANVQDRRRFLAGAAAAAGAAAMAGGTLGPATPATPALGAVAPSGLISATGFVRADAITGNPYVKAYPELAHRPYVPGYGFAELPFATEPGAFFSDALKRLFGVFQRCLCITPQAVLNFVGLGGGTQTMRMEGGVGVGIGGGQDNLIQQILNVVLHPGEHISRGFNALLGPIEVDHDESRPVPPSFILPLDAEQIFHQFIRIVAPWNWPEIIGNFIKNPLSIFEELLGFFFPVRQQMNFNVTVTCKKFPGLVLVNKKSIQVESKALRSFPPKNAPYETPGVVELVDQKNPNGRPLVVIEKWQPTIDHRKGLPPQVLDPSKAKYPDMVDVDLPCSTD